MLFNSLEFLIFLPVVFILYWFVFQRSKDFRNIFIIAASYLFYGWWDWRFLFLVIFSSTVDFIVGKSLEKELQLPKRKVLLWISIIVNLGLLGVFKYYNFFVDSFVDLLSSVGYTANPSTLNIILPVGISFYTFQTLSYTIDVYRKNIEASKDPFAFFAYVSFFPQLVAGPIERAKNLLPQFNKLHHFNYANAIVGMRQILWGFFKKIVIADQCGKAADVIFNNYDGVSWYFLLLGAVLFAFQIYGDFSGYSDIAIGTAKLFGFNLMQNFAFPYFSRDIAEFWRRWHISLSSWFKDYLYIPLGGSRGSMNMQIRNVFAIFLVSGFWHGANWTFLIWGGLNALYFIPLLLRNKNRKNLNSINNEGFLPNPKEALQIFSTFFLTCLAWIFFRSATVGDAFAYCIDIFTFKSGTANELISSSGLFKSEMFFAIFAMLLIEWAQRENQFGLENMPKNRALRWLIYLVILATVWYYFGEASQFIYFQF